MRKKNGTAKLGDLAILASSVGLVEQSEQGQQAFCAWLATDPKAARRALFARVAARRAASAQAARTGHRPSHPYRVPCSVGAAGLRLLGPGQQASTAANAPAHPAAPTTAPAPVAYPADWQPAPVTADGITFDARD